MLTKSECEKALNKIWHEPANNQYSDYDYVGEGCIDEFKILKDLIEEHFKIQPLSFAEIQKYMWIWDKDEEEWLLVIDKRKEYDKEYLKVRSIWEYDSICKFEPNRYYREEEQE